MATAISDNRVEVRAEISFHEALEAVEFFAQYYPLERLNPDFIRRLADAACVIGKRLNEKP